jgi:NAD(P)-dependent dehydrogenase (short-subunit alcohol dehydrogenase family)
MGSEGASVVVADLNPTTAATVVDELGAQSAPAVAAECDVTNRDQVSAAVDAALDTYGRLDGIVNLAYAGSTNGPFETIDLDKLRRELEVSIVGMFTTMQVAFPHLEREGGSIVNFSSGAGIEGTPGLSAYAAAKQGVRGLSLTAAREWGRHQIRVNVLCPLAMAPSVPLYYSRQPEGAYEASLAKVPLGRYGDAEADIGPAVAFLVSDDARFVTGQTIMLDGGQTHA